MIISSGIDSDFFFNFQNNIKNLVNLKEFEIYLGWLYFI